MSNNQHCIKEEESINIVVLYLQSIVVSKLLSITTRFYIISAHLVNFIGL